MKKDKMTRPHRLTDLGNVDVLVVYSTDGAVVHSEYGGYFLVFRRGLWAGLAGGDSLNLNQPCFVVDGNTRETKFFIVKVVPPKTHQKAWNVPVWGWMVATQQHSIGLSDNLNYSKSNYKKPDNKP